MLLMCSIQINKYTSTIQNLMEYQDFLNLPSQQIFITKLSNIYQSKIANNNQNSVKPSSKVSKMISMKILMLEKKYFLFI